MALVQQYVVGGGPVVWALLAFSVTGLSVVLFKIWQLWFHFKLASSQTDKAFALLQERHTNEALLLVRGDRNPRSHAISETLQALSLTGLDASQYRDESFRRARAQVGELSSHLRVLEVIATLAPLLGLLGTVLGMIEAFRAMEAAGEQVNPAILSGGIWQALLTTAMGLVVAIPVSLAHSWLDRRVERESEAIQNDVERVLAMLPALQPLLAKARREAP
ncbi:MotA/TolQ/ExbB proton channel family protein [Spongiibacter sp. KMU-158]|uniref:MotA/TolQ/ExbB proton channel family protein n=1 Tax=Spongiibacter pelagi TaxID=2760804 RepID=A0A927C2E0_9GAMM|nr:MotA/TolQ/ExbB proton channel family protein [Spongiibacter pelagi]MBD2860023.1 MotA/TolQ/ExbB proton channel family protein [Spongiibacter pelagi]